MKVIRVRGYDRFFFLFVLRSFVFGGMVASDDEVDNHLLSGYARDDTLT